MPSSAHFFSKFSSPSTTAISVTTANHQKCREEIIWKKELAAATTSVAKLLKRLKLERYSDTIDVQPGFKCLATDSYIKKIKVGDIKDPLLQQILPLSKEQLSTAQKNGTKDPVGDLNAEVARGLLHKYHGRALIISTGACAIHCRYCFRRDYPYQDSSCTGTALDDTLTYLNKHTEIEEVILSGGDPLILDNEKLNSLITKLEQVKHIQTLRIHTRIPVVLPCRITTGLLTSLQASRFDIVMVIHANHANELQDQEQAKLHQLHQSGVTLLNQSVLLKGINDNPDSLIALSKRLFQCKTLPYYLHSLDPVEGVMHFEVSSRIAHDLIQDITTRLPGYLVPKLVQEIAGSQSKTAIFHI
jgi:EF-P beta-lysylation protein EpmB